MRTIRLIVEYEGTHTVGWQRQKKGRSIQEEIEKAIHKVTAEEVTVVGSGRTDAGVHAEGQCAHFKTLSKIPAEMFAHALNAHLPEDISIRESQEAPEGFHAQFDVKRKAYRYAILNRKTRSALWTHRAALVRSPLDVPRMKEAAQVLEGRHDFRSFCSEAWTQKNTVRNLFRLDVRREGEFVFVEAEADGFLYNMVRAIVGTLIEVGQGKMDAQEVRDLLEAKDRKAAGANAPPEGLTLVRVLYDESTSPI